MASKTEPKRETITFLSIDKAKGGKWLVRYQIKRYYADGWSTISGHAVLGEEVELDDESEERESL